MKKQLLLLATFIGAGVFAQINRTDVSQAPLITHTVPAPKLPVKPAVDSKQFYEFLGLQNRNNYLYKQEKFLTENITSQKFETANTQYDSNAADDFTVPTGKKWRITDVFVSGTSTSATYPTSFNVTFYENSGSNLPGTVISTQNVVLTAGATSPTLPLAAPVVLSAGKYWMSVQAVLNLTGGGQWFWNTYADTSTLGAPFAWINPGNGFSTGCSAAWNTASICLSTQLKDLQFILNGEDVVNCKSFTGKISTTDPVQTNRVLRDGVPSTCPVLKPYPTDLSGAYHFKSHTIKNTAATAQCATITLTNNDAAGHIFLVAYSNTFNPANVSQNYLADSGTSAGPTGPTTTMDVNIPANGTVVLVLSEVTANTAFTSNYTLDVSAPICGSILRTSENNNERLTLYPNPTSGVLYVNGNAQKVTATDISGKNVPVQMKGNQIDMQQLNKGMYLIQLQDKAGKIHTEKVIRK